MHLTDFDYELPPDLIARYPLEIRSASRLFCLQDAEFKHSFFSMLPEFLSDRDLLVFNNTRVFPARIFGKKATGGKVEILIEKILDEQRFLAHVRASKSPPSGSMILINGTISIRVIGRQQELFELECHDDKSIIDIAEQYGEIPIPPYFHRSPDDQDKERYQTIYSEHKGSVAAPTAGLHFDDKIFAALKDKGVELGYVTLHIGSGTFAPVRVEDITQHKMHAEYVEVSETVCEQIKKTKERGGRVVAVGTTTARSLESASRYGSMQPFKGNTDIFIYPNGFEFQCIDALITNFHLPKSTLLMLVSAFAGYENIKKAYQEAIKEKYRFYSYGDAMFISR